MIGADFDSLEDKISALTTKDPNKMAVYESGYDGHSLRSAVYWPEKMPDIKLLEESEEYYSLTDKTGTKYVKGGTVVLCPIKGKITIEEYYANRTLETN
jgi:DNA polymerase-1